MTEVYILVRQPAGAGDFGEVKLGIFETEQEADDAMINAMRDVLEGMGEETDKLTKETILKKWEKHLGNLDRDADYTAIYVQKYQVSYLTPIPKAIRRDDLPKWIRKD